MHLIFSLYNLKVPLFLFLDRLLSAITNLYYHACLKILFLDKLKILKCQKFHVFGPILDFLKMLVLLIIITIITTQYDLEGIASESLNFSIHKMDTLRFCLLAECKENYDH